MNKKCSAKTSKGKRCTRNTRYYYCKQHWKSKIFSVRTLIISSFIALATIGGFYSDVFKPIKEIVNPPDFWACEQDKNIRGIILKNIKTDKIKTLDVQIGVHEPGSIFTNNSNYSGEPICFIPGADIFFDNFCTLSYRISENNQLLFSSEIYDIDRCLVGKIIDNEFVLNANCQFTWNRDDLGFEVVDSDFDVVFTLDYQPPNLIAVQGVFYDKDKFLIINDRTIAPIKSNDSERLFNEKKRLKPLFEYFGRDWFGKRAKDYHQDNHG